MVCRTNIKILIVCFIFLVGIKEAPATSFYIIVDKLGSKVKVKTPVKRAIIVTSYEIIPALNIWNQIAGVSRWVEEYCDLYKAFVKIDPKLKKPEVGTGTDLNIEAILKLNPDVVIIWTYDVEVIKFLEKKGITVIGIYPDTLDDLYNLINMYGKLFGKEKRAKRVIEKMNEIFSLIKKRVSEIPLQKRKKVVYLLTKPTTISCKIGVTNDLIELINAINLGGEIKKRYADVSVEKIIKWDPDIIFIWGNAGYDESWLYNNSQWKFIKAVENHKVYKLPDWSNWSPRAALLALYMAIKTYPEKFKDINFEKIANKFYKEVFGISYYEVKKYERN